MTEHNYPTTEEEDVSFKIRPKDLKFALNARKLKLACDCGMTGEVWYNIGYIRQVVVDAWRERHKNCQK